MRFNWLFASSLCLSISLTAEPSQADPAQARLGRLAYTAFLCAYYAEISENKIEQSRLFGVGLENARAFVTAYSGNKVTEQEASAEVPVDLMNMLGGPSADFVAGRLFESAKEYAEESVVKRDEGGARLPPDKWNTDPTLKKEIASRKFADENCALIR
jgi:hypothetical protein